MNTIKYQLCFFKQVFRLYLSGKQGMTKTVAIQHAVNKTIKLKTDEDEDENYNYFQKGLTLF